MDRPNEGRYDNDRLHRLDLVLAVLADMKEEQILSICREILDSAFPDSVGHVIVDVLTHATAPMALIEIAAKCGRGKRSILPDGGVRTVIDRLVKVGMVLNHGSSKKPRYALDRNDIRVQTLVRIYGWSDLKT